MFVRDGHELEAEAASLGGVLHATTASLVEDRSPGEEPVTWADAVVHLSEAYLAGTASPSTERYQVGVHVRGDRPGRDASLHLGPALPSALRRYRSCDATLRVLLEDDAGPVVTDTRSGRVLTPPAGPSPPAQSPADAARALGEAEADWRHPSGERLDRRWVMFARAG